MSANPLSPRFRARFREAHVLVPYTIEDGAKVSPSYDFPDYHRQLDTWFRELELPWTWHALCPEDAVPLLEALAPRVREGGGIILNLCDGSDEDGYPGLSVVGALERLGLPFTGSASSFYHISTCKLRTKELLRAHGVPTAPWAVIAEPERDLPRAARALGLPLFMKPAISAGSYGLGERSVLRTAGDGVEQFHALVKMREERNVLGDIFVESFVQGREFTGLVIGDRTTGARAYPVVERRITDLLEPTLRFLSYQRYWSDYADEAPLPEGEVLYRYQAVPTDLAERLADLCRDAYLAVDGSGYGRVDIRMDEAGRPFVLEVNANCGLSDDLDTSISNILHLAGRRASELVAEFLEDAWRRQRRAAANGAAMPVRAERPLKVCVLQPSYDGSAVDYRHYDPPRDLAPLLPGHEVHHEFLAKPSTYRQLRNLARSGFDAYVNLCEGYLDWDVPSVDVIWSLEHLGLPYTGPTIPLYNVTKDEMKQVAGAAGIRYPRFALAEDAQGIAAAAAALTFPLFVKPNAAGDSLGVHDHALVHDADGLRRTAEAVIAEHHEAMIEEYVDGREFTVLVLADPTDPADPLVLNPIEFVFPAEHRFKTYDLKVREYHPEANRPCADPNLAARLRELARRVFVGFEGVGYARIDVRMDAAGELWFLEANFTCSIFYPEGSYGSADYILRANGLPPGAFLQRMIAEAVVRHGRTRKRYRVRPAERGGFCIVATEPLRAGDVVFPFEEREQRLVSLPHIREHWDPESVEVFRRYAYPVGPEVFILWPRDPAAWAPQNHSCDPNTVYRRLDVVAARDIAAGEELTLDYGTFYAADMPPFACHCGAATCRGTIYGRRDGPTP